MDVLLSATRAEGFGVPIVEAQACGIPVIVTDFSSMPELVPDGTGWRVPVDDDDFFFTDQDSYQVIPKVSGVLEALEKAYVAPRNPAIARENALLYDADLVTEEYWVPVLAQIEKELPKPSPLCVEKGHNWSKVGVYVEEELVIPCLRCDAELRRSRYAAYETMGKGTLVNGIDLDLEDDPKGGIVKIVCEEIRNSYDLDSIPFENGDVALDIGAHVGIVSVYLAKRHPGITVYAFEPVPENFARLERNIQGLKNVIPVPAAVADGEIVTLHGNLQQNSGGASMFASNGAETYQAPSLTLQDIFERYRLERVKLLKLDCEGAEYGILEAGEHLLKRVDYLVAEFHTPPGDPEKLYELCARHLDPAHLKVHACALG